MRSQIEEAIRYLGYGRHAADEQTMTLIEEMFTLLDRCASSHFVYRIFPCQVWEEKNEVQIGTLRITSKNLCKNLSGCEEVYLFAATLGSDVDLWLRRYGLTAVASQVVLQACSAARLEDYCNEQCEQLSKVEEKRERYLRPRFSPGYGDFSIQHQKDVLRMLDTAKKIGLTMTDSYMLTPTKSVTAVIGIGKEKICKTGHECETCDKLDCKYRRD